MELDQNMCYKKRYISRLYLLIKNFKNRLLDDLACYIKRKDSQ